LVLAYTVRRSTAEQEVFVKLYRLRCLVRGSGEAGEGRFVAEAPDLPGCRAWGGTAAEALENLQSVVAAFIESYRDRGDSLPAAVRKKAREVSPEGVSELLVAV
jgi:predicted RNase H-like HicB family nuclease